MGCLSLMILPALAFAQKNFPVLTPISPTGTPVGAAVTVTINGSGFLSDSTVLLNGTALATTYVSSARITAQVPSSLVAAAGAARMTVYNPGRGGGTSNALTFTIGSGTSAGQGTSTTPTPPAPLAISTTSVPSATVGTVYRTTLQASGGTPPYTWKLSSGALPAGVALVARTGAISGVPSAAGSYGFIAQVTDAASNTVSYTFSLAVAAAPASIGPIIPATLFGMHIVNNSHWPTVPIGALGKGTLVVWPYVEQTKGAFNWSNLDAWVGAAQSHGVSFFFSPEKVPPWAAADPTTCAPTYPGSSVIGCTSTVANIQDWDNYVTALVMRYRHRIQIYELWNEPDNGFTGTMADLVTLTTHEYNIIRAIDPAALILSPSATDNGIATSYLGNYFAAGGPAGVDGVSIHPYVGTAESAINYVNDMKATLANCGLSGKGIWDTEGSWGTASLTSDAQVAAVARLYLLFWSNGVQRFYWYAWDNSQWGTLWDATNGPHPAAMAYQQVYNWMAGASMSTPCSRSSDSTWTCGFARPGGYAALAVWNTATTEAYAPASNFKQYRDLSGNIVAIPAGSSVTIGPKPILLETSSP